MMISSALTQYIAFQHCRWDNKSDKSDQLTPVKSNVWPSPTFMDVLQGKFPDGQRRVKFHIT